MWASKVKKVLAFLFAKATVGLEIIQHGVDLLEFGQIVGLSRANDRRLMRSLGLSDGGKARHSVGKYGTPRRQIGLAHCLMALRLKPETGVSLILSGRPSSVRETAATNRTLGRLEEPHPAHP